MIMHNNRMVIHAHRYDGNNTHGACNCTKHEGSHVHGTMRTISLRVGDYVALEYQHYVATRETRFYVIAADVFHRHYMTYEEHHAELDKLHQLRTAKETEERMRISDILESVVLSLRAGSWPSITNFEHSDNDHSRHINISLRKHSIGWRFNSQHTEVS